MGTILSGVTDTVTIDSDETLEITGPALVSTRSGAQDKVESVGRFGPYGVLTTVTITAVGADISYRQYSSLADGKAELTEDGDKINGATNPDGTTKYIGNPKEEMLVGASVGDSSSWLPVATYPERWTYKLDSGSTSTTFSIDFSADGLTSLGQAFTGSYSSSSVAEITPPILFTDVRALFFKITVNSGGPITFARGV